VHVLVVFVEFGGVSLGGESCETFFVDVDSERLIAGNYYVDS